MYNWINQYLLDSFSDFKLDLYDKFIILNFTPAYDSESIIIVIFIYIIQQLLPFLNYEDLSNL